MTIRSRIVDGLGRRNDTEVTNNNALKVSTLKYYNYTNEIRYFLNPTYGFNMNVNASSNLDELVHNGIDDIAWTGSNISGTTVIFDSTVDPYAGSNHINGTSLVNNTTFQLTKSSPIGTSSYVSMTGYVNLLVLGNPTAEFYVSGYNTATSSQVGVEVSIFDYINTGNLGVYQPFTIPLSSMGLSDETIDSFRFRASLLSGAMTLYLDNIYLTSIGAGVGPQVFTLAPVVGETLLVDNIEWFIVDDYDGVTGQNGTMKLEWDKVLGETLTSGIIYQQYKNNLILFSENLRTISSWLSVPRTLIENYSSDGINTLMNINYQFAEPYLMTDKDKITLTVEDNLSGFIRFRAASNCRKLLGSTGNRYELTYGCCDLESYGS